MSDELNEIPPVVNLRPSEIAERIRALEERVGFLELKIAEVLDREIKP